MLTMYCEEFLWIAPVLFYEDKLEQKRNTFI